ncbi:MAG: RidA family protein [Planctomycetota bacterium]|jgi:enamine deaminase RidA (YjgF/YER057c/UK114 family)
MSTATDRVNISTGTPWEKTVGYSRAVRVGSLVFVTGTLAADERGRLIGGNDAYAQTVAALDKVEAAIVSAGARIEDVVRTRIFVTDMAHMAEVGRAHAERFGTIRPCTTMVAVSGLALDDAVVEIEADAVMTG